MKPKEQLQEAADFINKYNCQTGSPFLPELLVDFANYKSNNQLEICKNKVAQSYGYKDIQEAIAHADTGDHIEEIIDKVAIEYRKL